MVLNLWLKCLLVLPKTSDFVEYKFALIQQVLPVVVAILSYILCVFKDVCLYSSSSVESFVKFCSR